MGRPSYYQFQKLWDLSQIICFSQKYSCFPNTRYGVDLCHLYTHTHKHTHTHRKQIKTEDQSEESEGKIERGKKTKVKIQCMTPQVFCFFFLPCD